jgi:formylglycine-generating enzyme required for sulfatase activity
MSNGGSCRARSLLMTTAAVLVAGCDPDPSAPPFPEVLIVVDTNLPVPLVASRLRVDLYDEDGTWFDSVDFGRPDPRDWPASFSVYSEDESRERDVWVRLRVYPEGAVDSYEGERFRDVDDPFAIVPATNVPRLVIGGQDVTPGTEPTPLLTVDRLVRVPLRPQTRGSVRVLLDGICAGTMVKMAEGGTPAAGAETCIDVEKTRAPVELSTLLPEMSRPTKTAAGTWLLTRCPTPAPGDSRICIPGGATILGSRENSEYTPGSNGQLDSAPPRVFGLTTFFVDRDELSVKELRDLVEAGYTGALPYAYDGTLAQPTTANKEAGCTWSLAAKGRDDYPVTCVSRRAARDICRFKGGDLLTEAQWEHVATIAGHGKKTRFPWGFELPTCDRAVWGRIPIGHSPAPCPLGDGPRRIEESANDLNPLGVRGLFGSVSEWVRDDALPFVSAPWAAVSIVDPVVDIGAPRQIFRGVSWFSDIGRPTFRFTPSDDDGIAPVGVRCAYPTVAK